MYIFTCKCLVNLVNNLIHCFIHDSSCKSAFIFELNVDNYLQVPMVTNGKSADFNVAEEEPLKNEK